MKTKFKTMLVAGLVASATTSFGQTNYVSPVDPELKTEVKFNNPMRNMWSVGGNVGVDVSTFTGGIFGEASAYFSPKRLSFKASYAFDVSGSDFISKSNLYDYGNTYGNLQLTGIFNFKDEISEFKASPAVGFDVISSTVSGNTRTTKGYLFTTDFNVKIRKTRGFGVSLMQFSSNTFYDAAKVDQTKAFITLANNAQTPTGFILPWSTTTIGLSYQMAGFASTKVKYNYKKLTPYKFKQNYYKIVNLEVLFAPNVKNGSSIFYDDGTGNIANLGVTDVKKKRLGFRVVATTNQFKKLQGKPGFYMNGEAGMRPGIYPTKGGDPESSKFVNSFISQPWYMKFGVGFAF